MNSGNRCGTSGPLDGFEDVRKYSVEGKRLHSATHEEILGGYTTDVYFVKTRDVLRDAGRLSAPVTAEVFARKNGVFAGLEEVMTLLAERNVEVEALREGDSFSPKEVLVRICGPYGEFGLYETVLLGMLASASSWATAARACVEAADGKPVLCFGARHVHPAIAPVMERTAVRVGGCSGASCILGARLAGIDPMGTVPHAAVLLVGDTVALAKHYDAVMPSGDQRIVLVDTFKDEAEETLRVAEAWATALPVRLDTPANGEGCRRPCPGNTVSPRSCRVRSCPEHRLRRALSRQDTGTLRCGSRRLRCRKLHFPCEPHRHDHGYQGNRRASRGKKRKIAGED